MSGTTFGTGADTLVVTLSEDAYQGDAQANISLDGKLLNSTPLTVTASRAARNSQAYTFKGTFGSGQHTVGVTFLNDAYGGPGLDRNLWVNAITLNGTAAAGMTGAPVVVAGGGDGTSNFIVSGGTSAPPPAPATATLNVNFNGVTGKLVVNMAELSALVDSLDEAVSTLPIVTLAQAAWVPISTDGTSLDGRVPGSAFAAKAGS